MFLEPGLGNLKLNRESRRIYNNSGMPPDGCVIYSGCNRFPGFPIRLHGTMYIGQGDRSPLFPRRTSAA